MKRRAKLRITPELLARLLHLHHDVEILRVETDPETDSFVVILTGPGLPLCPARTPIVCVPHAAVSEFDGF